MKRIIVPIKRAPTVPQDQTIAIPKDLYKQIKAKLHKIAAGKQTFGQNVWVAQDILGMLIKNERESKD